MRKLVSFAVILASLVLLLAGGFASADQATNNDGASLEVKTARDLFVLPKQFDFDIFQKLFNKSYSSALERLVRARLYLGRAFRAFISKIGYKHGKLSSYLGINHMSDWTPEELRATVIDPALFAIGSDKNKLRLSASILEDDNETLMDELVDDETPAADLPSIKRVLKNVVENKDIVAGYEDIAEELLNGASEEPSQPTEPLHDGENNGDIRLGAINAIPLEESNKIVAKESGNFLYRTMKKLVHLLGHKRGPKSLPDEIFIDHRGCLLEARSQGRCGSCYSFSTIALYEWAYCKATGEKVAFSEQYPIDCGNDRNGINGCRSGLPGAVRDFSRKHGLQLLSKYPYIAREQTCQCYLWKPQEKRSLVRILDNGMDYLQINNIQEKLEKAPVVMAIFIESGDFHEYEGGVDMGEDCRTSMYQGAHGMLLVGSGREDGQEYWLLRNSFGPRWGQKGHYKLNKQSDCVIDDHGLVLNFAEIPEIH